MENLCHGASDSRRLRIGNTVSFRFASFGALGIRIRPSKRGWRVGGFIASTKECLPSGTPTSL